MTDDELRRLFEASTVENRRYFDEAVGKFSHAELDRRFRALEDSHRTVEQTLADVQARLDRLESSTH